MKTESEKSLHEILDTDWIRSQFYSPMSPDDPNELHRIRTLRYQTTANTSIGGSGLGNSRVLNPPPGLNKFADTPRGVAGDGVGNEGTGVYHHEMLEKPMDIVHFKPGVARTNPAASFWTNAFEPEAMEAVEYGWVRKAVNFVGSVLGYVLTSPFIVVGTLYKTMRSLVLGVNANKYSFYYLHPAPFLFWKGLDDMANLFMIKIGFTGNVRFSDTQISKDGTLPNETNVNMEQVMEMMPGIFSELSLTSGYRVDTIALAHRYNMLNGMRAEYLKTKSQEILGQSFSNETEYYSALAEWEDAVEADPKVYSNGKSVRSLIDGARGILNKLNVFQADQARYEGIMGATEWKGLDQLRKSEFTPEINTDDGSVETSIDSTQFKTKMTKPKHNLEFAEGKTTEFQSQYASAAIGGLDFFSLAVDRVESVSVGISNSVGPSGIESMFNGTVSGAKNAWFSASNGNISDGIIGDTIGAAVGGAKAFVNGLANGVTGGIQSALFGGKAFIDIADVYQNTTTSMPAVKYSFTSQAISGHPISKLQMILPILAVLRCGAAVSGGPRSFMSPFLLSVIHKGRNICNMGLMTNVNLEWGGEAGWDINDIPCEIKCDFTVTNLDKNLHVPLDSTLVDIHNDESNWDAITNILAGVSPTDLDRSWGYNIKTNWARSVSKVDRFFSSSYQAASLGVGTRSMFEGPITLLGGYVDWR